MRQRLLLGESLHLSGHGLGTLLLISDHLNQNRALQLSLNSKRYFKYFKNCTTHPLHFSFKRLCTQFKNILHRTLIIQLYQNKIIEISNTVLWMASQTFAISEAGTLTK